MSIRSITPWSSCSLPIGISVATTCGPKACLSESRERKKSARSRSSMFTKMVRASPSSDARSQRRLVVTSTPITPFTTKTAPSTTRSAASASAMKLGSPGVSTRLILRSSQRNEERLAEIDISRAFSSDAESETVLPSATEPSRLMAPASNRSASFTDVLPLPRWPTNATLRILFGDSCAIRLLPSQVRCEAGYCESAEASESYDRWSCAKSATTPAPRADLQLLPVAGSRDAPAFLCPPLAGFADGVALEARLQPQHGLRVQLRDARLGHAEHLADLPQREVLVVVEGHDELLALRQPRDRVRQAVLHLGRVHLHGRVERLGVLDRVQERDLVTGCVRDGPELVERHHRGVGDAHQRLLELLDRHLELVGHLLVCGRPMQLVLELRVRTLDLPGLRAHRAGHPVERAQLVDDRALDARDGERLELDLALGLEALDRGDQAEQTVGDQVRLLHMGGQAAGHPAGYVLDERRVREHESLARLLVALILVAAPKVLELDRLEICLHVGLWSRTRVSARTPS